MKNYICLFPLTIFATCCLIASGCDSSNQATKPKPQGVGTVSLEIDYGTEKAATKTDVVCSPDSTVLTILERARDMGELKLKYHGSGEGVFVDSIGGFENDDANGKSWIYRVNDELGDRSAGVFPVSPGDKVTWSYGSSPTELAP